MNYKDFFKEYFIISNRVSTECASNDTWTHFAAMAADWINVSIASIQSIILKKITPKNIGKDSFQTPNHLQSTYVSHKPKNIFQFTSIGIGDMVF